MQTITSFYGPCPRWKKSSQWRLAKNFDRVVTTVKPNEENLRSKKFTFRCLFWADVVSNVQ